MEKEGKKVEKIDPNSLDFRQDVDPNALYELNSLLGEGSYGAVYRARSRAPEKAEEVAIKIIPDADDDLTALWREIRFLQVLRSPFVVSFVESLLFDNELWLVMELCDGGSLYDLKEANQAAFSEDELKAMMSFCVLGLAHLHAQMSIHRDVKSGNILLTRDGRAKLGDFGISAQLTDTIMKRRTVIGSPYWMAPEVIQETSYDGKADIWSLGITLLELCEGSPPYFNVHPMRAIFMISSKPAPTLKEPEKWSSDMQDFVSKCLVKDCEKRSTAADLLKHPWIRHTVREIGPAGKGLPVLENLIEKYWETVERLRTSRFKLPDNIGDGNEGKVDGNQDENNIATMRSNGIPATRQQIRNASLSKSLAATMIRSRASSNAPRMINYDYDDDNGGTMVRRPAAADGTFVRSPYQAEEKDNLNSIVVRHNNSNNGYDDATMRRSDVGTFIVNRDSEKEGTFQRFEPAAKEGQREEIQAALKYFRDEPLPPLPDAKQASPRAERKDEQTKSFADETKESKVQPPAPPSSTDRQVYENEVAILDTLTTGSNSYQDETVEELRKVRIQSFPFFSLMEYVHHRK